MPTATGHREGTANDIVIIRQAILGCYFAMRFLPAILFFVLVLSLPVQFVVSSIWFWIFVIMTLSLLRNKFAFRMGTWLHPNVDPVNLRLSFIDRDFNENDYELLLALDESTTSKRKGTAMAIVQGLPSRILAADLEEGEVCPICLEQERAEDCLRQLPCKHEYHTACIDQWLAQSTNCPTCKYDLLSHTDPATTKGAGTNSNASVANNTPASSSVLLIASS